VLAGRPAKPGAAKRILTGALPRQSDRIVDGDHVEHGAGMEHAPRLSGISVLPRFSWIRRREGRGGG